MRALPATSARFRACRASFREGSPRGLGLRTVATVIATLTRGRPVSLFPPSGGGGRAGYSESSALGAVGLGQALRHEADVRVAREGRRLEHALHDQRGDTLVDLENGDSGERLAGVDLLPQLALALEHVEELVHALQAVRLFDRPGAARRDAV